MNVAVSVTSDDHQHVHEHFYDEAPVLERRLSKNCKTLGRVEATPVAYVTQVIKTSLWVQTRKATTPTPTINDICNEKGRLPAISCSHILTIW